MSEFVDARYARLLAHCHDAGVGVHDDAGVDERIKRVLLASDFASDCFEREPTLLGAQSMALLTDPHSAQSRPLRLPDDMDEAQAMRAVRRYRRCEALRLIWRDVNDLDAIEDTLAGSSALAQVCLAAALAYAEGQLTRRHGIPRDEAGKAQRMVVFALGKLGGAELNFSSDIDLILAYPDNGRSDGARALENEIWFARAGQLLVKLLAEISVDGQAFRVDLRLRPFGTAGRVALSFAAMEQYYQREGRDWERYAWIKARPVAGDISAGNRLIDILRPFVYRRYFDYTAFAGLREMKTLIDAQVARKDMAANLKLGPGGIREVEFVVQLLQLIRGGREPSLRERGLLPALAACERLGALPDASARRLRHAYRYLRRIENRVQMLRDEQTHDLPDDPLDRARIAGALGLADWDALHGEIWRVREDVIEEFHALLAPEPAVTSLPASNVAADYWQRLRQDSAKPAELVAMGFSAAAAADLHEQAASLRNGAASNSWSIRARARRDRLVPQLIEAAAASKAPDACLQRLLRLLHAVMRRSAYLALLEEQVHARERVVALFADSALLADRVIAHPLLLDDLFAAHDQVMVPDRRVLAAEIDRRCAQLDETDAEAEIEIVQEEKHSAAFRIGLAYRDGLAATTAARMLSDTAQVIVARSQAAARRDIERQHGRLGGAGMAAIGYGSLGGEELGFDSDLDLVFVYDATSMQPESDGPRPMEGARYCARIAQRVVHWLTTRTRAGQLYEVDVRLRPDGGSGLLVTSLDAFVEYQFERAWIWETQALVRARAICGDDATRKRFGEIRAGLLTRPREAAILREQIGAMRVRWRSERDRSDATHLDLKQGPGALLDIEFILQFLVLLHASRHATLLDSGNSAALIALAASAGVLAAQQACALSEAHAALLARALDCTLDARRRVVPLDATLMRHTAAVLGVAAGLGLELI
ncbi:MAG TPA: bifunctional [glutamate--ammonia ligase]-adenylyl-L-tyrosine phosphorylase/[glutamate--ammonia-ligase] adenylyltransferase [Rudaea sp.]|nr:bifunctional [glutamate--ammonia ligase]-adenylyl-L-tyrosine phosphorylase/[glutamate--ammonia-ligase] adenylyltransferase [Rudaea sp.]